MYLDGAFNFVPPTVANSNTRTASHADYILDLGSGNSKILFGADARPCWLTGRLTVTADASPTLQVDFVASDESDLDPNLNASPLTTEVLASTGTLFHQQDGGALATGDAFEIKIPILLQRVARRYYGIHIVLGGTNPDLAAGQELHLVFDAQTNMIGPRAAAPA